MVKEYHRLVRNNEPQELARMGAKVRYSKLDSGLYEMELLDNLEGVLTKLKNSSESIGDYADAMELLKSIAEARGIERSIIDNEFDRKNAILGGYSQKNYVIDVDTL